jgi:hypothetical protein
MQILPLTAHYKIPETMKALDWIVEALEEDRRDVEDVADERTLEEESKIRMV